MNGKTGKKNEKDPSSLDEKLKAGISFHKKGDLENAFLIYSEINRIDPGNADAAYLSGVVCHQQGNDSSAVQYLQKAIRLTSSRPEYITTLAKAYNNLGLSLYEKGDSLKAIEAYLKAIDADKSFPLPLNNLGMVYQAMGEYDKAIRYYEDAINLDGAFFEAWMNKGLVLKQTGRADSALASYEKALSLNPESWQIYLNVGILLKDQGLYDDAVVFLNKAIELNHNAADAWFNLGSVYQETGELKKAEQYYLKCTEIPDMRHLVFNNLGNVYKDTGRFVDAFQCYCEAVQANNNFAGAHNNAGVLLLDIGQLDAALEAFSAAQNIEPKNDVFLFNLGLTYLHKKQYQKSLAYLQEAIAVCPASSERQYALGILYKETGDYRSAHKHLRQALDIAPESDRILDQLIMVCQFCCLWDEYEELIITMKRLKAENDFTEERPFHSLSRYEEPEILLKTAVCRSREVQALAKGFQREFSFENKERKTGKIRLGYLSNTFMDHPGGQLIAGLFGHHNRDSFEVFCYSYGLDDGSFFRKKAEASCDVFIDIRDMAFQEAAERIYNDKIDILIDLRGHTTDSRLEISALRPAPIQVVWLGFPGTSGADFFDYIIADSTTVPIEDEQYYTETVIRLPMCYQVNDITQPVSDKTFSRLDFGLPEDGFVFCSFNNSYKFEPVMYRCWMNILKRCDNAVLWLLKSNEQMTENLWLQAEKNGIEKNRIVFAEKIPKAEHLGRHRLVDMGLDTRICNGHTTTSDALMAGVPVLTVPGRTFPSRVSAAILKAADLKELIFPDLKSYEAAAVRYAQNPEQVRLLKEKIANRRENVSLFNTEEFARNLEILFHEMWETGIMNRRR